MIINNKLLELDAFKSFIKEYDFPKELKVKIIVTPDMDGEYKKQLQRLNKKYDYISPIDYNGITCVPNTIDEETIILINYDRVDALKNKDYGIIRTLFHELIHAKDYYNYAKEYCDGKYDSSKNRDSLYGLYYWSEFNAKKISYYEYCKLAHGDILYSNEKLKNIEQNELPVKNKEIEEYLTDDNIDIEYIIYNLMFYLGRYSIWEKLFPREFGNNAKFPDELNKYKPVVDELYKALKNNSTINYNSSRQFVSNNNEMINRKNSNENVDNNIFKKGNLNELNMFANRNNTIFNKSNDTNSQNSSITNVDNNVSNQSDYNVSNNTSTKKENNDKWFY